jgi:hypothetical protein
MMFLSPIRPCSLLLVSVMPETATVGRIIVASFVEVHCSPSFVNKRNFDARYLAVPGQLKNSFNSAVLTSSIHHDYVDDRDVASPSGSGSGPT